MKLDGINGKGSGKSGAKVYYVNHGVQIEREYSSHVSNPNTDAQVTQRSRFKLASQVSAALQDVIVIPRKGIMSPRNLFVKKNMSYFYGSPEGAQVSYENLQITQGSIAMPRIRVLEYEDNNLIIQLAEPVVGYVDAVVWNVYQKTDDNLLILKKSEVVQISEENSTASITYPDDGTALVVYAYGLKSRNAKAKAAFSDYEITTGSDVARLFATRRLNMSDFSFTVTRGTTKPFGEHNNLVIENDQFGLYLTRQGAGSVSLQIGSAQAQNVVGENQNYSAAVDYGSSVTLVATPSSDSNGFPWDFDGWYNNGEQQPFSTASTLTFTMSQMRDIVARFSIHNYQGLE